MAIFGKIEDLKPLFSKTQELESLLVGVESVFSGERLSKLQALNVGENYKVELNYGMFYIAHCYALKSEEEGFFESHQEYIDFQVVVEGFENYLIGDRSKFAPLQSYDESKDLEVHTPTQELSRIRLEGREMAVLFPYDIHGVGIGYGEEVGKIVRKVIFKVPNRYIKHRL
ncbi:YhcH/YjgK/YiaL family protein [Helicobacter brantae]|uniref:YhcH/YjgK/YiaL family protein n=1 Tax=Helicobacter brantae TaxID=375927 RepID=A0A3D8J2H1_9HELI|nr:YhcH/YjgK/YiaL family protein [Helicobacter brantae]RDU70961.1 hypothetical protein CQA58_04065 [Helicobacter brantae]